MGGYNWLLVQVILVGVILSGMATAALTAAVNGSALPNCPNWCGDVEIPYPFGIGEGCYLNKSFSVNCTKSSDGRHRPQKRDFVVQQISIQGQIDIFMNTVEVCNNRSGLSTKFQYAGLRSASNAFTISNTQNVFIAVGCDTYAYLTGKQNNGNFSSGCMSICQNQSYVLNGTCCGTGCCQVSIPERVSNITLEVHSLDRWNPVAPIGHCLTSREKGYDMTTLRGGIENGVGRQGEVNLSTTVVHLEGSTTKISNIVVANSWERVKSEIESIST